MRAILLYTGMPMKDIYTIRNDFPILRRTINGKRIVYLDSTATSLKPQPVIDAVSSYYTHHTANVFRGIYTMSEEATALYEQSRSAVAHLIGAKPSEIVFTRNTSESLNLFAYIWLAGHVSRDDRVVTTIMEHHSNFVPWQQFAKKIGYELAIWYTDENGCLDEGKLDTLITKKTKLLTFTAASNVLGTIPDVTSIVKRAREINPAICICVDAAQAVPHMPVDVTLWGADVVAFSGHKMLGPSGVGALWAKETLLNDLPPFLFGGDMIREVHETETVFNDIPHKFEAGTPNIEGVIGFGAAASYLSALGMQDVRNHEESIVSYALSQLGKISGVSIYGPKDPAIRGGVIAFRMGRVHPHDIAQVLDEDNVCIRVGYHCAMPLHEYMGIGPTARASFYVYSDRDDVDALIESLKKVKKMFGA